MPDEPEIFEIMRKIRYDLTAAQAKVTEALNVLGTLSFPKIEKPFRCPLCSNSYETERALAIHVQNLHDGPQVPLDEHEQVS